MTSKNEIQINNWRSEIEGVVVYIDNECLEGSFEEYFKDSIRGFPEALDSGDPLQWDYVFVVPRSSWEEFYQGNDGSQGFRHKRTGYTIPDLCRQIGGTPEVWTNPERMDTYGKQKFRKFVNIASNSPIFKYLSFKRE